MKRINRLLTIASITLLFLNTGCLTKTKTTIESFDGVNISFDNEGKGDPVIILIHGWANTRNIWEAQISHFSEKYQVIAVDLPGFGKSGNNRIDWSTESYGKDIAAIIQGLNLNKVVLVGFSLGAPISIECANLIPDHII